MIKVVEYSERACAVFGDTKAIKEELKEIGGKYNRFLTDPEDGEKKPGWIFQIKKMEQVKNLVKIS